MKVAALMEALERLDPDAEVLIAHQPSWPLQERLADVVDSDDLDVRDEDDPDRGPAVVYLVAGGHPHNGSPYAPRAVFEGAF